MPHDSQLHRSILEENDSPTPPLSMTPRTANPGGHFVGDLTRRKEILLGTSDKVNPTRTMARRAGKIVAKLGPAAGTYFWMIERIGGGKKTRFLIENAAAHQGVSEKTIDRHIRKMKKEGFISVENRKYHGKQTYSEYTLLPINELIQDDGQVTSNRGTQMSPGPRDTDVPTKRTCKKKMESTVSSPSSLNPTGVNAEAGRAATATSSFQGGIHTSQPDVIESISSWCEKHVSILIEYGFKEQSASDLRRDVIHCLKKSDGSLDQIFWGEFVQNISPLLMIKVSCAEFFNKGQHSLRPGWLFRFNKDHRTEYNFQVLLTTTRWGGIILPDTVYGKGEVVQETRAGNIVRIVDITANGYEVCAARLTDPAEIKENTYTRWFGSVRPLPPLACSAAGDTTVLSAVASRGPSEALASVERPPTPLKAAEALRRAKEDQEVEELRAALEEAWAQEASEKNA